MPFLVAGLALSVGLNLYLLFKPKPRRKTHPSQELNDFVGDLVTGGLVYMRRIDPNDFLLRSPKRKT